MNLFFIEIIENWYHENRRDLPWRDTNDAYSIWISEIILQQTRVAQGLEYYLRFMKRFPTVAELAAADETEVLRYWQGLGYYSRARNLHAAAKSIVGLGGVFPTTYKEVHSLKGVGDYTAAAICSFAYGQPYAVLDGNVYRVLSRFLAIDTPIDSTAGKKLFAELAQQFLDVNYPALYNQAIMDFGAIQCVPVSPDCSRCPLIESCSAYRLGLVNTLPIKERKTKVTERFFSYVYVRLGNYILLRQRKGKDIWHNLHEIPLIESARQLSFSDLIKDNRWQALLNFLGTDGYEIKEVRRDVKHVLSHQIIHADFYAVQSDVQFALPAYEDYQWVSLDDIDSYPVSRLISILFEEI